MAEDFAPIPLVPETPQEPALPLPQEPPVPLPPDVATSRANDAVFGINKRLPDAPTQSEYYSSFVSGDEDSTRKFVAAKIDEKNFIERQERILSAVKDRKEPLTQEDVQQIVKVAQGKTEPISVVEKEWAKSYMDHLGWPLQKDEPSFLKGVFTKMPAEYKANVEVATNATSNIKWLQTLHQNNIISAEHQGWPSFLLDEAKKLTSVQPIYQRYFNTPPTDLFALPHDEYVKRVTEINESKNPGDRVAFTQYLLGESRLGKIWNNVFPLAVPGVEVSAVAGLAKASVRSWLRKGILDMAKGAEPKLLSEPEMTKIKDNFQKILSDQFTTADTPRMMTPNELVKAGGSHKFTSEEIQSMVEKLAVANVPREFTPKEIGSFSSKLAASLNRSMTPEELYRARLATQRLVSGDTPSRMMTTEELGQFQSALKDMVQHASVQHDPEVLAPTVAGDLEKAVTVGATKAMQRILDRRADPVREADSYGVSLFGKSSEDMLKNPGNFGNAATQQIVDHLTDSRTTFNTLLDNLPRNEINPALREKLPEMVEAAKEEIKAQVKTVNDRILDVVIGEPQPKTGSWFAEVQIGKSPTEFFKDKGNATKQAIKDNLGGFEIKQTGAGWYISKQIPININSPGLQKFFIHLPENQSQFSTWNAFFSRLLSPNETFSQWANRNRLVTTHAPAIILDYMNAQLKPVEELAKRTYPFTARRERLKEFQRVIDNARAMDNPDIPGAKGYTFKNPAELEYHYMKWLGRLPDPVETKAYFAWKNVTEMDHALRVVSLVKGKQANGVMAHQFHVTVDGEKISSPEFEATPVTQFPGGSNQVALVIGEKPGNELLEQVVNLSKYEKDVNSGKLKMAKIWATDQDPLKGWGSTKAGDRPTWIIAKNMETKPLDWQAQLPMQGGGHFIYDASHWLVQPKLSYSWTGKNKNKLNIYFEGASKYMPFTVEREGENVGKVVNEALGHLQKRDVDSARNVIETNLNGVDFKDDFFKHFLNPSKRDPLTGRMLKASQARFNYDMPFQVLANNKELEFNPIKRALEEKYGKDVNIVDSTRSGNPSKQFAVEFTQERDASNLFTISNEGSAGNPIYNKQSAPMLDATSIMNRSMTKLASSFLMNDYKIFQFSHWLQEHRDLLKDVTDNELANSPLYWFHHAEYSDKTSALAKQAEIQRMQIRQFLGQYSDHDNFLQGVTQKLINSLYERVSPKAAKAIDPTWLLHTLKDPAAFFRSMTFHLKFGWSMPQLLVQGNTFVNILGIAGPEMAAKGTMATMLHQWARINASPAIIDAMDRKATYFGWRPGEWKEAYTSLVNSGYMTRGRQHALRDDFMSSKVISTGGQKFLDWGAWFFNEGDRATAMGSWYTAFREYRDVHPTGALTNADRLKIMERADTLNNNMSRASNALYQKGWSSLPTQFLTYSIRQAELMWGHRLTPLEKARLLGTQMIIYGIPTGLSITGLPSQTWIRQNAIKNGYIPENDNYFQQLMNDGAVSTAIALVGGTKYNVAERYGGGGITKLDDLFNPDKTMWDIFGGATGSTVEGIWDASDPFRAAMLSLVNGDDRAFKVTGDHVLRLGEEATAIQSGRRAYEAYMTGDWMSKNRVKLANDATTSQALMSFITGLLPNKLNDRILYSNIIKEQDQATKDAIQRYNLEVHRAMQAFRNDDDTNGHTFWTNAAAIMDKYIPADEKMKVMRNALQDWWPVLDEVRHKFHTKGIPPELKPTRTPQYYQYEQGKQGNL